MQNLKGKGNGLKAAADSAIPKAYLFETGRNEWRRFDAWPPKNAAARSLYFDAGGKLSWNAPAAAGFDEYAQRSQQACALAPARSRPAWACRWTI